MHRIIKVKYDARKTELRAGAAKHVPTGFKGYIGTDLAFECIQGKLGTEYRTERVAQNESAGNSEFIVTEML